MHRRWRWLGLVGLLAAVGAAGCGSNETPPQLAVPDVYPVRTDWLVANTPKAQPSKLNLPGYPPLVSLTMFRKNPDPDVAALLKEVESRNVLDTGVLSSAERQDFQTSLTKLFGTPAAPKVEPSNPDPAVAKQLADAVEYLKLDAGTLAHGAGLYRRYCLQCHGLTGDGNGPSGRYLYPAPRDYRPGVFKFISTDPQGGPRLPLVGSLALPLDFEQGQRSAPSGTPKPRRADLKRTIQRGLDGTAMPSFSYLSDTDVDALVSYVIHLAVRGECEYRPMKIAAADGLDDIQGEVTKQLPRVLEQWERSQQMPIVPYADPFFTDDDRLKAARDGYMTFTNEKLGGCAKCHVNFGRSSPLNYDMWGGIVQPRNLTVATFRGGGEPVELYYRIYGGIHGSGMPSHAHLKPTPEEEAAGRNKLWELVHFVRTVSTEPGRQRLQQRYGISVE